MRRNLEHLAATPAISYDAEQKKLTVRGAHTLAADTLHEYIDHEVEILDASHGNLTDLPDNLPSLKHLRVAFFSNHDFESVPEVLSQCENLELVGLRSCNITHIGDNAFPAHIKGIILTDNQLEYLPPSIGAYNKLQKLMLSGNHLKTLPHELLQCENLELVRLAANQLAESPDWLFELPRLAWYADAGNPFHDSEASEPLPVYPWHDIDLKEQIGKSANNTVHYATLANGQDVAVKLYGSGLSTDGLVDDEIAAYRQAGTHPHVVSATHETINDTSGQRGLVMPLISSHFSSLGLPPNLSTHTRDILPQNTYTEPFIHQTLSGIASAMTHLHARGVMHGDLYAHNIMTDQTGAGILGDLGAASRYSPRTSAMREHVDARAFGFLIDDLLSSSHITSPLLSQLREACLNPTTNLTPRFHDIHTALVSAQ